MTARLIYSATCSLDGYTVDSAGGFAWAAPDEQAHAFVNDQERGVGTYLYGRRMYETMRVWQQITTGSPAVVDYGSIWRAADKIVYSTTLRATDTPKTQLVRSFVADEVRAVLAASTTDVSIGGPTIAAAAIAAGLVDEYRLLVVPVSVGGGLPAMPPETFVQLTLADVRRFDGGAVALSYTTATPRS